MKELENKERHIEIGDEDKNNAPKDESSNTQLPTYNFDTTTIIVGLQILPETKGTRQVIITVGIKGEPPIITNTILDEITKCPAIAQLLEQLKQALPKMAKIAAAKEITSIAAPQVTSAKTTKAKVPPPDLPAPNTTNQVDQLSLFT